MGYKEETKKAYDLYPEQFEEKFNLNFQQRVRSLADIFLKELKGKKILDVGSGPGIHADYFQKQGFEVLCIDNSKEMIRLCRKKGLNAKVMDFENLSLLKKSLDGIWAYASLVHAPKHKIPVIVKNLALLLKPRGLLGLAMKEGNSEEFETKEKFPGAKRFFVYCTDKEIRTIFGAHFDIIYFSKDKVLDKFTFLNYIFKLK